MASVTITTTTAVQIVAANSQRISVIITNEGPNSIYLGADDDVTTATGVVVLNGGNFTEDSGGRNMYLGPIYAVTSSTTSVTSEVRYWERSSQ